MTVSSDKVRNLAKDTGLFAISSFGSKILLFLLTPLYTGILSTAQYGIADLLSTTVLFAYPLLTLSVSEAALRFAMEKNTSARAVFDITMLFTALSFVLVFILKPFAVMIDVSLDEYWLYFWLIFCLNNIHTAFSNFIKGKGHTQLFAVSGIVQTVSVIIADILFLVVFDLGIKGYLWGIIAGYAVSVSVMFFGGRLYSLFFPFSIDKALMKDMLRYCIPVIPTTIAWAVNTGIDKYMIIGMVGMSDNGVYSIAHKIPGILTAVMGIFISAWQLSAISNHGEEDESRFQTDIYRVFSLTGLLGCFLLITVNRPLSYILFAKEFHTAWMYVPFLIVSAYFASLSGFLASAFRASKQTGGLFVSVMSGAVLNVILNLVLISAAGTIGAAAATALSFFTVWLIRMITVQKILPIKTDKIRTAVSYTLFFAAAALSCFDQWYSICVSMVLMAAVCIIERRDIKYILNGMIRIIFKPDKSRTVSK